MPRAALLASLLASLLSGCADDSGVGGGATGGGGVGGGETAWQLPAAKTCSVSLPSLGLTLTGTGHAERNGTGNMIVRCFSFEGTTSATMEVWVGNGDYAGPGDYPMINDGSRGHVTVTVDDGTSYENESTEVSTGCDLTIDVAQPGSSYPDVGTRFGGHFSCTGLADQTNDPALAPIDVQDGAFDLEVI